MGWLNGVKCFSLVCNIILMKKAEQTEKQFSDGERQKKKDCTPTDNYSDHYVDPVAENSRPNAGKGDKIRIKGWYSEEITEKMKMIFGKEK